MTPDDFDDEPRASLSLLQVYRLIALEQIEMDRRVAERPGPAETVKSGWSLIFAAGLRVRGPELRIEFSGCGQPR